MRQLKLMMAFCGCVVYFVAIVLVDMLGRTVSRVVALCILVPSWVIWLFLKKKESDYAKSVDLEEEENKEGEPR